MSSSCDLIDRRAWQATVHGNLQARILEWVAISFSRGYSQPRNRTCGSCIVDSLFTNWATREDLHIIIGKLVATIQGLQRWRNPNTSVSLQKSGSLVLAHLNMLTRHTQLWGRVFLHRQEDLACRRNFGGAVSNARVNCVPLVPRSALDSCCFDKKPPSFSKARRERSRSLLDCWASSLRSGTCCRAFWSCWTATWLWARSWTSSEHGTSRSVCSSSSGSRVKLDTGLPSVAWPRSSTPTLPHRLFHLCPRTPGWAKLSLHLNCVSPTGSQLMSQT